MKTIYSCRNCGALFAERPEVESFSTPFPRNICVCGEILSSYVKYKTELVSDDFFNQVPKITLKIKR